MFVRFGLLVCCVFACTRLESMQPKVIAFDLHGVLLHYRPSAIVSYLWQFHPKWELLKGFARFPVCALLSLLYSNSSFEQVLDRCCGHSAVLRECLVGLSVLQSMDQRVQHIVDRLVASGHEVDVVSNIGAESFRRLKCQYYDTFAKFSVVATSGMRGEGGALLNKPDARFFHAYLERRQCPSDNIVFVDDRSVNTTVARSLGFQTILFKSARQLQDELEARNLITGVTGV